MGVVYMAEQTHPIKMRVALKIIKPGMDSKQVIARFESERQALALMDHPNIAKVLAAGTTDSGHPYFAMELVRGEPITTYCDKHHLTLRERLQLFHSVCSAVQHAHQKGIIHRDLKPSNVLVARYDGHAVPKVIDFGVAKATGQQLTERTLFTRYGQVVGTLEYMSPEQVEFNQVDVDTRSDIYSLGILLYELLTGTTPFDADRFRSGVWDEIVRIIRDEEPPRPSVRITTNQGEPQIAVQYGGTDPSKFLASLRGELDWLVMKALAKERDRRYETASAFAEDVQRYLNGEAIQARPPSTAYRLAKAARRHQVALALMATVFIALLGIAGISCWFAVRLAREANRVEAAKRRAQEAGQIAQQEARRANRTLASYTEILYYKAIVDVLLNNQDQAMETLQLLRSELAESSRVSVLEGLMALNRGDYDMAVGCADDAVALGPDDVSARALHSVAYIWAGQDDLGVQDLSVLRGMNPASDADRLLTAYAMLSAAPEESLALLDIAPAIQYSPVGLMVSAFARLRLVAHTGQHNVEEIEKTVRDFEYSPQRSFRNEFVEQQASGVSSDCSTSSRNNSSDVLRSAIVCSSNSGNVSGSLPKSR